MTAGDVVNSTVFTAGASGTFSHCCYLRETVPHVNFWIANFFQKFFPRVILFRDDVESLFVIGIPVASDEIGGTNTTDIATR